MKAHIEHEVCRESRSLESFARARDGISLSKAATLIAHNLGDLDRVIDMWNLPADDPLRLAVYKAGTPEGPGRWPALLKGGRLNTALMADENHRHFSLRGPKCLRRDASLLLPLGPFFDEWGLSLTRHRELSEDEVAEVAEALVDGWEWLQKGRKGEPGSPFGYPRALAGIAEGFPGGVSRLQACLPKRIARTLKAGPLHSAASIPRARFEAQWAHRALKLFSA